MSDKMMTLGEPGALGIGGTSTAFCGWTCKVCGKLETSKPMECRIAHEECLRCPGCKSNFTVWKYDVLPIVLRCLNCLHRWEAAPAPQEKPTNG